MRSLLIAALLAAGPAIAETAIVRNGENWLRLKDEPCSHGETLARIKDEWKPRFKNARASIDRQDWFACWMATNDGQVFVVFEDGDTQLIPMALFKPDGV